MSSVTSHISLNLLAAAKKEGLTGPYLDGSFTTGGTGLGAAACPVCPGQPRDEAGSRSAIIYEVSRTGKISCAAPVSGEGEFLPLVDKFLAQTDQNKHNDGGIFEI